MSFEEISHTADVKIRVRAPTLEALFSETSKSPHAGDVRNKSYRR